MATYFITIVCIITLLWNNLLYCDDTGSNLDRAELCLETGNPDSVEILLKGYIAIMKETPERERAAFYLAQEMEQMGRAEETMSYLEMIRKSPYEGEYGEKALFLYTELLFETGKSDSCIAVAKEFKEHFSNSPLLPDVLFMTGYAYFKKGDYLRASNTFTEIIRDYPDSKAASESLMKHGVCLFKLGLISGAIEDLRQYLTETPEGMHRDEALYFLGLSYDRNNARDLAIECFKRVTLDYPSYDFVMDAHYRLGKNYFEAEQYDDAENSFLNFIYNTDKTSPNYDEALFYLERIKFRRGEYTRETDIAENFIAKYPASPRAPKLLLDLADYYRAAGNTNKALDKFKILMNNPLYHAYADSAALLLADVYVSLGKMNEASAFLQQRALEYPFPIRMQTMYFKLGSLNETWKRYDEAITWYDSSLVIDASPKLSFQALWGIGRSFLALNRLFEATTTYERIIHDYPDTRAIRNIYRELGRLYLLQGRIDNSTRITEKSLQFFEGREKTDMIFFLAGLYEERDNDQALKLYSLIYSDSKNTVEQRSRALLNYGDIAYRRGDDKTALNAWEKIISGTADSSTVILAKQRLIRFNESRESKQ